MVEVTQQIYNIVVDDDNPTYAIPASMGLMKGDIIVFRGEGDPVRLPVGTAGQVLTVDPTSELGVRWM